MSRFSTVRILACVVVVGVAIGWTQAAQAQCENGLCKLPPLDAPITGTAAKPAPAVQSSAIIAQPMHTTAFNGCGYVSSPLPYLPYDGYWTNGCGYPNVAYSGASYIPVGYSGNYSIPSGCPGGSYSAR